MAKAPITGAVKTRMAPPLTHPEAAELARALLRDQLDHLAALGDVDLYVVFAPAGEAVLMQSIVPPAFTCFPQRGDDLGERMEEAFAALWSRGHRDVILTGSDVPAPPLDIFRRAFEILSRAGKKVVLGPSQDGGYYLIGMNRPVPEIFRGMGWSHNRVLSETIERLMRLEIDFELFPEWYDLDTVDDLRRFEVIASPLARATMKRTLEYWRQLRR